MGRALGEGSGSGVDGVHFWRWCLLQEPALVIKVGFSIGGSSQCRK